MITRLDLDERVREWRLRDDVVEKDYVLGWLLWGIGSDAVLGDAWVFKGGTCLKKCYIETYRFSEDLDFTVMPGGPSQPEAVLPILRGVLDRVAQESGLNFSGREPTMSVRPKGGIEGRVFYNGPRGAQGVASVKIDLSATEVVVRPTVLQRISHVYPDRLPEPATVRCYSFEELFAEKIRAMGERSRPRDLYDIVNLFRRDDLQAVPALIRDALQEKCRTKGVPVPTLASVMGSDFFSELKADWANMLAHQLPALPPFQDFIDELPNLFAWLEGTLVQEPLEAAPATAEEAEEEDVALAAGAPSQVWSPPPTAWVWGSGSALESIRFAAVNHLCVDLSYDNKRRVIEPYSLRRTKSGNLLLHAVKVDTREARTYRVDRIQGAQVLSQSFKPMYAIEFSSKGRIN
nr:nucleotidyl transferase AbiEii/AbiGii toxin family protein [Planctomycetota bacterium]